MWMDRGYLVGVNPPTVLFRFFKTSLVFLVMVWRYACSFDIILRLFLLLFSQVELSHFYRIIYNEWMDRDTLWAQLLLQFDTNYFETLLVFWSWSEDIHVVKIESSDYACHFFCKLNLGIFQALYLTKWMDRGYLVGATPSTGLYLFFWNFTGVWVMIWINACGLDTILKLIFVTFFSQVEPSPFFAHYL